MKRVPRRPICSMRSAETATFVLYFSLLTLAEQSADVAVLVALAELTGARDDGPGAMLQYRQSRAPRPRGLAPRHNFALPDDRNSANKGPIGPKSRRRAVKSYSVARTEKPRSTSATKITGNAGPGPHARSRRKGRTRPTAKALFGRRLTIGTGWVSRSPSINTQNGARG